MRLLHYLGQNQALNFSKEIKKDTNVTLINLVNEKLLVSKWSHQLPHQ